MISNITRNVFIWALLAFITAPAHMVNATHNAPQTHGSLIQSVQRQCINVKKFVYKHRNAIIKGALGVVTTIGAYYLYQYLRSLMNDVSSTRSQEPIPVQCDERVPVADTSATGRVVDQVDLSILRNDELRQASGLGWHDGDNLIVMLQGGRMRFWNIHTRNEVPCSSPCSYYSSLGDNILNPQAVSREMNCFAGCLATNQSIIALQIDGIQVQLDGHTFAITKLTFHARLRLLASCSFGGELKIWDVDQRRCICSRRFLNNKGRLSPLRSMSFNGYGDKLAVLAADGTIYVMTTQELLRQFAINQ